MPALLEAGGGSIVNTGSVNSLVAEPFLSAYDASKGGVLMLSKAVALDFADQGIRCNCLCPGWVDTPINHPHAERMGGLDGVLESLPEWQPIGRQGFPEEIAAAAVYLASDESAFMTGSAFVIDVSRFALSAYDTYEDDYEILVRLLLDAFRQAGFKKIRLLRPKGNELFADQLLSRDARCVCGP